MKQKLQMLCETIKQNRALKAGCAAVMFVVVLAVIWLMPMNARNISVVLRSETITDETPVDWTFHREDAFEKVYSGIGYFCGGAVKIKLHPEFQQFDAFTISGCEDADEITSIEILAGNFEEKEHVITTIEGEKLFDTDGDVATLKDTYKPAWFQAYHKVNYFKWQLSGILCILFLTFMLYLGLEKRFTKFQRVFACLVIIGSVAFCVYMNYNHSLQKTLNGTEEKSELYCLTDGTTKVSQQFTAISNRMSSVVAFYKIQEDTKCGIVMQLRDLQTGEIVGKTIFNTSVFTSGESTYELILDEPISNMGGLYEFETYAIDQRTPGNLYVASSIGDLEEHGQLYINGQPQDKDLYFSVAYVRVNNMLWGKAVVLVLGLFLACFILAMQVEDEKCKRIVILAVYVVMLGFALFKMLFYLQYVGHTPDESKHIAYVAYLEEEQVILPKLKEMKAISIPYNDGKTIVAEFNDGVNYLRHPPLYYQLLRLANAVSIEKNGTFVIQARRLRLFSMSFVVLAIALMFYVGYTRLEKKPVMHLLYSAICVSVPMLTYGAVGISNDSLTILTVTIFFLAMLRMVEHKWNALTYWMIALSMSATLLTKTTAGLLVAIAGVIVLLYYLVTEKCYKELLKPAFLSTIPVYGIALAYFILLFMEFGNFQPTLYQIMDEESVRASIFYTDFAERTFRTFDEYVNIFFQRFFQTWTGISSHVYLSKFPGVGVGVQTLGLLSLWVLPFVCLFAFVRRKNPYTLVHVSMLTALVATLGAQFVHAYRGFMSRGYEGGFQSRYYLCAMIVFAFSSTICVQSAGAYIDEKKTYGKFLQNVLLFGIVCFVAMLFYEDFVFFLTNFSDYPFFFN